MWAADLGDLLEQTQVGQARQPIGPTQAIRVTQIALQSEPGNEKPFFSNEVLYFLFETSRLFKFLII